MPGEAIRQAEDLLANPALVNCILEDVQLIGVVGELTLALSLYVVGSSRLLDKPLAAIIQGLSSTGKSHAIDHTSLLFPHEAMERCTDFTAQSLYYMRPGALIHRWVLAGERARRQDDEQANATRALRELISSRYLRKKVVMKINGRMETVDIETHGPIAYIESTTLTTLFELAHARWTG